MKKTWIALSVLALILVACTAVQDLSDAAYDAGLTVPQDLTQDQSQRLIATGNCPAVEVVEDLASVNEFTNEKQPLPENIISSANIKRVQSTCSYGMKSVTVDMKLEIDSKLGPQEKTLQSKTPFFSYPYFVAVLAPNGQILAKEVFAASMTYEEGAGMHNYVEELRQIIPTRSRYEGSKFKVLIGFQLSDEQLDFNRQALAALKIQQVQPVLQKPMPQ